MTGTVYILCITNLGKNTEIWLSVPVPESYRDIAAMCSVAYSHALFHSVKSQDPASWRVGGVAERQVWGTSANRCATANTSFRNEKTLSAFVEHKTYSTAFW